MGVKCAGKKREFICSVLAVFVPGDLGVSSCSSESTPFLAELWDSVGEQCFVYMITREINNVSIIASIIYLLRR